MTHSDRDGSESPEFATGGPVRGPQYIIVNAGCPSGWAPLGTDDKGRSLGFTTTTTAPAGLPLHESADRDADNVPSDRLATYAEAIDLAEPTLPEHVRKVRAVMAVADREQAELRAENERLTEERDAESLAVEQVHDGMLAAARRAERAEATLDRVEALHVQNPAGGDWCNEDGFTWPCPTARALRGPEPAEATSNEDAPGLDVGADAPTPVGPEPTDAP